MLKKKVKIFNTGIFPQGEFNLERVKEIFNNTKDKVIGQFCHTSKIEGANKQPLNLGTFSEFNIEDGNIFADIEFNEKGKMYYEDGAINGCSVEIGNNEITKVAFLPINEKPQISSAEFSTEGTMCFGGVMEFAASKNLNSSELNEHAKNLDMSTENEDHFKNLRDTIWDKGEEKYAVDKLKGSGYNVDKQVEEFASMTNEEIRKKITESIELEFSLKEKGKEFFDSLKAEGKISKKMEDGGVTPEFFSALYSGVHNNTVTEFAKKEFNVSSIILDFFKNVTGKNMEQQIEFNSGEADRTITFGEEMEKAVSTLNGKGR